MDRSRRKRWSGVNLGRFWGRPRRVLWGGLCCGGVCATHIDFWYTLTRCCCCNPHKDSVTGAPGPVLWAGILLAFGGVVQGQLRQGGGCCAAGRGASSNPCYQKVHVPGPFCACLRWCVWQSLRIRVGRNPVRRLCRGAFLTFLSQGASSHRVNVRR